MSKLTLFIVCSDSENLFSCFEYVLNKHYFEVIYKKRLDTSNERILRIDSLDFKSSVLFCCLDLENRQNNLNKLVDNIHVLKVLSKIRKIKNGGSICYVSRKENIAREILKSISVDLDNDVRNILERKINRYKTEFEVIRQLKSSLSRSKLEVIRFNNKICVKKTFRDNALKYLENELICREKITHKYISPILEKGENYIIIPYYENIIKWNKNSFNLYPVNEAKQVMEFIKWINSQGFALLDWNPGVAIFDKNQGLKFIDFEYFTETPYALGEFRKNIDFSYIKTDNKFIDEHKKTTYVKTWYPALGISYDDLISKPGHVLFIKRASYLVFIRSRYYAMKKFRLLYRALINRYFWTLKYRFDNHYLILVLK